MTCACSTTSPVRSSCIGSLSLLPQTLGHSDLDENNHGAIVVVLIAIVCSLAK